VELVPQMADPKNLFGALRTAATPGLPEALRVALAL